MDYPRGFFFFNKYNRGKIMQKLLELLNSLVEKYNIQEEDVMEIQSALAAIEGAEDEEFEYEPVTEEVDISEEE